MWKMTWKNKYYEGTYEELTSIIKGFLGPKFERL